MGDSFLAMAEELQLKGLMRSDTEEEVDRVNNQSSVENKPLKPKRNTSQQETKTQEKDKYVAKIESSPPLEGTVAVTDYTVSADLQDLDDKVKSMMGENEDVLIHNRKARTCKVCGKEGHTTFIKNHIESMHITGVSHTCNICGTTTRSRDAMRCHKRR